MAQIPVNTVAPTVDGEHSIIETFTLQVVSPSVGVNGPLSFSRLSSATTIKQLKEKIREALPIRPADENQRLIHRGRLLARETETMAEVFGQDTLKNSGSQTLHLVLRPSTTEITTQDTGPLPQDRAHTHPAGPRVPLSAPIPDISMPPFNSDLGASRQTPIAGEHAGHAHYHPHHPHQLHQLHHHHSPYLQSQSLTQSIQRLYQLQQEGERLHQELLAQQQRNPIFGQPPPMAAIQNAVAQRQQERAAMGMQGVQQPHPNATTQAGGHGNAQINNNSGLQRPDHATTYTQEGVGPNGERWQLTVNETTTIFPNTNFPQARIAPSRAPLRDIQNIVQTVLRAADSNAAQQARQDFANPTPSSNVLINGDAHGTPTTPQLGQAGLSNTPHNPPGIGSMNEAINRSPSAPPDASAPIYAPAVSSRASSQRPNSALDASSNATTESSPIVYILSSPTGPRALLINRSGSGIEAFFTPRQLLTHHRPHVAVAQNPIQARIDAAFRYPEHRNRGEARIHRHARRQIEGVAGNPALAHPQNPNAGAVAAQIWPHIWLIARLIGFVWFFTSGNSSWWRMIMVSSLAFIVFIANTGVLNGIAEQIWGPIRRHLEALIPLAGPNGPQAHALAPINAAAPLQGQAEDADRRAALAQTDPGPAQVAASLIEQRRLANGNWLWTQFRRVEHATLLFLASLIPGVGERHIAARAAEENIVMEAERQRQEAENSTPAEGDSIAREERSPDTANAGHGSANEATAAQAEVQRIRGHQGGDEEEAENNRLIEV